MVVEENGGECRCVHPIFEFFGYLRRQFGIEGVDAFYHEHIASTHAHLLTARYAATLDEVVLGQLHFLAVEQLHELLVEQRQVEGVQRFEVVIAVLVLRSQFAVDEVVVERHGHGAYAVAKELYAQSLARCSLART